MLLVTVAGACTGSCGSIATAAATSNVAYAPAATLTDAATPPNAAAGSLATSIRLF